MSVRPQLLDLIQLSGELVSSLRKRGAASDNWGSINSKNAHMMGENNLCEIFLIPKRLEKVWSTSIPYRTVTTTQSYSSDSP